MFDETVTILSNDRINGRYFKLVFRNVSLARKVLPGQFLNVQIEPGSDPLLRRPFSYYRVHRGRIEILYEILGRGTGLLSNKKPGDCLKVLGPLGQPFRLRLAPGTRRVLVAGGIGVPPLIYLAEKYRTDAVLIGAKSHDEILPRKELSNLSVKVSYATNDGSYGQRGFVTVLLEEWIRRHSPDELFIQTCGPKPMMQAVIDMARRYSIRGQASIDENMACGVGACLGCMVETPRGRVPSCVEGPVFDFEDINGLLTETE